MGLAHSKLPYRKCMEGYNIYCRALEFQMILAILQLGAKNLCTFTIPDLSLLKAPA